jgi:hypothetical protein
MYAEAYVYMRDSTCHQVATKILCAAFRTGGHDVEETNIEFTQILNELSKV